mmetsp:Transcript_17948/g.56191  ORF Transcript_17948/g.56191 Transcript_17948/m.56191 type:complete len:203 (-) Transcript_17948:2796-3404(-)
MAPASASMGAADRITSTCTKRRSGVPSARGGGHAAPALGSWGASEPWWERLTQPVTASTRRPNAELLGWASAAASPAAAAAASPDATASSRSLRRRRRLSATEAGFSLAKKPTISPCQVITLTRALAGRTTSSSAAAYVAMDARRRRTLEAALRRGRRAASSPPPAERRSPEVGEEARELAREESREDWRDDARETESGVPC